MGTKAALDPAINILLDADIIRTVQVPSGPQGGRPLRLYEVHPATHEVVQSRAGCSPRKDHPRPGKNQIYLKNPVKQVKSVNSEAQRGIEPEGIARTDAEIDAVWRTAKARALEHRRANTPPTCAVCGMSDWTVAVMLADGRRRHVVCGGKADEFSQVSIPQPSSQLLSLHFLQMCACNLILA